MKLKDILLFLTIALAIVILIFYNHTTAQNEKIKSKEKSAQVVIPDLENWPEPSRLAAKEMMRKYGNPDESTPHKLIWYNNGPWKRTVIFNYESRHLFSG